MCIGLEKGTIETNEAKHSIHGNITKDLLLLFAWVPSLINGRQNKVGSSVGRDKNPIKLYQYSRSWTLVKRELNNKTNIEIRCVMC